MMPMKLLKSICFLLSLSPVAPITIVTAQNSIPTEASQSDTVSGDEIQSPQEPEALKALQPSSTVSSELRYGPSENAPIVRNLQSSDRYKVLRSQGEWFEVDVLSESGLEFRGWIRGGLPLERQATPLPPEKKQLAKTQKPSPLRSSQLRWLWFGEIENKGHVHLGLGLKNLKFTSTGLQDIGGSSERISAPGYDLMGLDIHLDTRLTLLETELYHKPMSWFAGISYEFGFFSVTFGGGSLNEQTAIPTELEGVGYSVKTHNLKALTGARYELRKWQDGSFSTELAAGLFYLESSPDLRRTDAGNVVFTKIQMMSPLLKLNFDLHFKTKYQAQLGFGLPFFESFTEETGNANEAEFKTKSFSYLIDLKLAYKLSEKWSVFSKSEVFQSQLKKAGTSLRINESYEELNAKFGYWKSILGIGYNF